MRPPSAVLASLKVKQSSGPNGSTAFPKLASVKRVPKQGYLRSVSRPKERVGVDPPLSETRFPSVGPIGSKQPASNNGSILVEPISNAIRTTAHFRQDAQSVSPDPSKLDTNHNPPPSLKPRFQMAQFKPSSVLKCKSKLVAIHDDKSGDKRSLRSMSSANLHAYRINGKIKGVNDSEELPVKKRRIHKSFSK